MIVYHDDEVIRTTVSIPARLHEYAKEQGINLSGTLREVLRKDYEEKAGAKDATPTQAPRSERPNAYEKASEDNPTL